MTDDKYNKERIEGRVDRLSKMTCISDAQGFMAWLIPYDTFGLIPMMFIRKNDMENIVEYFNNNGHVVPQEFRQRFMSIAAQHGTPEMLSYFFKKIGKPLGLSAALFGNNTQAIHILCDNGATFTKQIIKRHKKMICTRLDIMQRMTSKDIKYMLSLPLDVDLVIFARHLLHKINILHANLLSDIIIVTH